MKMVCRCSGSTPPRYGGRSGSIPERTSEDNGLACSQEATDPCKVGVAGSTLLSLWLGSGGRMEIVPGGKAREKPEPAFGYWKFGTPCCVVAGDHHDCQRTSLHELGHCLNFLLQ